MHCRLNIIVAVAQNGIIGGNNCLLWHISEDLRRFKRLTTGCPVIMGRKTFESIGRPLPARRNIVISRQAGLHIDGCEVFPSLVKALEACGCRTAGSAGSGLAGSAGSAGSGLAGSDCGGDVLRDVFVIGGGEIYRQAMPLCDRILLTRVMHPYEGDTRFPEIDPAQWRVTDREEFARGEKFPYPFVFETLERR